MTLTDYDWHQESVYNGLVSSDASHDDKDRALYTPDARYNTLDTNMGIGDSGSSSHITNSLQDMTNLKDVNTF